MSPLSFSHTFSHQRDRPCRTFPGRLCTACTPVHIFTICMLPLPQVGIPAEAWGRGVRVTKLTPRACPGKLGWGHRAGCSLLNDSPCWWVVKLLSQWFPMKSLHQEVPHLGSLGKKSSSAGNCFLKTALEPGEAAEDLMCVRGGRGAGSVEPGSPAEPRAQIAPAGPALYALGHSSLASLFSKEEGFLLAYKRRNKWDMGVCMQLQAVQAISNTCLSQA